MKKSSTKKDIKKEVKKEEKKETKKVEKKIVDKAEIKKATKKILTDNLIAILLFICSLSWIASGLLNIATNNSCLKDFIIAALLLGISLFYFIRGKKNK